MSRNYRLKRSITLPFLVCYGLGTMVGGGFYALLGKVAGEAGLYAPLALLVAGLLALLSGLCFAELGARYPVSAGEARYVQEGFGWLPLSVVVGWLVILTGVVSAAALAVATVGFMQDFVAIPGPLGVVVLVLMMGAIAAWGIGQSAMVVAVITVVEALALILAGTLASSQIDGSVPTMSELLPPFTAEAWSGILAAAFLAFYAFIGFEDMVNVAEEVKSVRRTLPKPLSSALC